MDTLREIFEKITVDALEQVMQAADAGQVMQDAGAGQVMQAAGTGQVMQAAGAGRVMQDADAGQVMQAAVQDMPALCGRRGVADRLLCAESGSEAVQVKRFPKLREPADVFAICWNLAEGAAYTALLPADPPVVCRIPTVGLRRTERHSHDYLELAYVVEGELQQRIQEKNVSFSEGELLLVDRNCVHQDYVEGNRGSFLFLGIRDNVFQEALSQLRLRDRPGPVAGLAVFFEEALLRQKTKYQYLRFTPQPERRAELEGILYGILVGLSEQPVGGRYLCRGLVLWLIQILCEADSLQLSREESGFYRRRLYGEVMAWMEEHYQEVTLSDLVERFRFQEDYFTRLLKEYSGQGFKGCLQEIRLNRAEALVRETDLKMDEIVSACGYHNKGYFYELFRRKFGMTPAELRRKACQGTCSGPHGKKENETERESRNR